MEFREPENVQEKAQLFIGIGIIIRLAHLREPKVFYHKGIYGYPDL